MKPIAYISLFALTLLVSAEVYAKSLESGPCAGLNLVATQDASDTSGTASLFVVHDFHSGLITASTFRSDNSGSLTIATYDVRAEGYFDGRFLTAADLDGDQRDEIILPGYQVNEVLALHLVGTTNLELVPDRLTVAPGPFAVAPFRMNQAGPEDLVIATTASANVKVRGWDYETKQPISSEATFPPDFAQQGLLGFEAFGTKLGILRQDAGDTGFPVLELFNAAPEPAFGPMNSIRQFRSRSGHQILLSGLPDGTGWFLAYAPGNSQIELFPLDGLVEPELHHLGAPVECVRFLPEVNDEVLVAFEHGDIHRYSFVPGTGLNLIQTLTPDSGQRFIAATGVDGNLLALAIDSSGTLAQFHLFEKDAGGTYQQINQGAWPSPGKTPKPVTVVVYTGNPFTTPTPFVSETFLAGDWATDATYSAGQAQALVETFGSPSEGLANPVLQSFQLAGAQGFQAQALGNQWEPSSSLFHLEPAPTVYGLATVKFNPPPGDYPNSINLTFEANPLVTVHYRVNQQPWHTGLGPVTIAQSSTVQFYGRRNIGSGVFSTIQTIDYVIGKPPNNDTDGDLVPDAIEALAGSDPFDPDSDDDGENDFSEILSGTDPNNAASKPSTGVDVKIIQKLLIQIDDTNSVASPSRDQVIHMSTFENEQLNPAVALNDKYVLHIVDGVPGVSRVVKPWLPANFKLELSGIPQNIGPAMIGFIALPPPEPPTIPVDLTTIDPLADWIVAAQNVVDTTEPQEIEFTFGPSSTLTGLLFEYWYGLRLLDRGRIVSIAERPRLADTPRSIRAGIAEAADLAAIETPQTVGLNLTLHEITHAVQQVAQIPDTVPEWTNARDAAFVIYEYALQSNQSDLPLDPPIDVLRGLINGEPLPNGYVLHPDLQGSIVVLRDAAMPMLGPHVLLELSGTLAFEQDQLILETTPGERYLLLDNHGQNYDLAGSGLVTTGSTASVAGLLLTTPPPAGINANFRVVTFSVDQVPAFADTDQNTNGIPDTWELAFLGGLGFGLWDDVDGDLFVVGEEYAAGSDPRNRLSSPEGHPAMPQNLALFIDPSGNPFVTWDGSMAAQYDLMASEDFERWQAYPGDVMTSGDRFHFVPIDFSQDKAFFQLRVNLSLP